MGNHWPIAIAVGIIALAAVMGTYQHDRAAEAAVAPAPAAVQPAPNVPGKANATPTAVPAERPLQGASAVQPAVVPAALVPAVERAVVAPAPVLPPPVAPVAAQKPDLATGRPFKPAALAPAGGPAMPNFAGKHDPKGQLLQDLRTVLQEKLKVVPRDLGVAGAFAAAMEGVRVEVQPWPQWSVHIYNFNRAAPEQETESFKSCLEIVATTLNIDMTPQPVKNDLGKSFMKTSCSLGPVSLIRDPATNNSCVIRPIQANAIVPLGHPNKAGDQIIPRPPKPVQVPVAPPRPPPKDEIF